MRRAVFAIAIALAGCGGAEFSAADFIGPTEGDAATGPDGVPDVGPGVPAEGGTEGGRGGAAGADAVDAHLADAGPKPGEDAPPGPDVGRVDAGDVRAEGGQLPPEAGAPEGGADVVVDATPAEAGPDVVDAAPCGPSNCAGCCAPTGQCVGGDTVAACGKAGRACMACSWRCQFGTPWACGADAGAGAMSSEAFAPVCTSEGFCDTAPSAECCGFAAGSCEPSRGCR